jgi:hypothetical protein
LRRRRDRCGPGVAQPLRQRRLQGRVRTAKGGAHLADPREVPLTIRLRPFLWQGAKVCGLVRQVNETGARRGSLREHQLPTPASFEREPWGIRDLFDQTADLSAESLFELTRGRRRVLQCVMQDGRDECRLIGDSPYSNQKVYGLDWVIDERRTVRVLASVVSVLFRRETKCVEQEH